MTTFYITKQSGRGSMSHPHRVQRDVSRHSWSSPGTHPMTTPGSPIYYSHSTVIQSGLSPESVHRFAAGRATADSTNYLRPFTSRKYSRVASGPRPPTTDRYLRLDTGCERRPEYAVRVGESDHLLDESFHNMCIISYHIFLRSQIAVLVRSRAPRPVRTGGVVTDANRFVSK